MWNQFISLAKKKMENKELFPTAHCISLRYILFFLYFFCRSRTSNFVTNYTCNAYVEEALSVLSAQFISCKWPSQGLLGRPPLSFGLRAFGVSSGAQLQAKFIRLPISSSLWSSAALQLLAIKLSQPKAKECCSEKKFSDLPNASVLGVCWVCEN